MYVFILSTVLIHMAIGAEQCPTKEQLATGYDGHCQTSCPTKTSEIQSYLTLIDGTECPGCVLCYEYPLTEEGDCYPKSCNWRMFPCAEPGTMRIMPQYFKAGGKQCDMCEFQGCW